MSQKKFNFVDGGIIGLNPIIEEGKTKGISGPRNNLDLLSQRSKSLTSSKIKNSIKKTWINKIIVRTNVKKKKIRQRN